MSLFHPTYNYIIVNVEYRSLPKVLFSQREIVGINWNAIKSLLFILEFSLCTSEIIGRELQKFDG